MKDKFQYRVMNFSEAEKRNEQVNKSGVKLKDTKEKLTWLDLLNELGGEGWEVVNQPTKNSYLLKRRLES